ncbi:PKD domain-containing protein [Echinicola jeungdonensis]|uniref:PKD domain-containing protein n=1 Tax=Echinicola jeungdonensis TaxID=709343 RepID=A0ABV5J9G0_9BACT|nr:PKD domain-containing protein [Echinicola jeungdonensis]MDN3670436.1 PKD domain-containing protein [Echinicola jeungdonensis]
MKNSITQLALVLFLGFLASCNEDTDDVNVNDPVASFTFEPGDGPKVKFDAEATNASAYFWEFGDGYNSNEEDPVHNYEKEGEYNVKLMVYGEDGSKPAEVVETVNVNIINDPVADFIYEADELKVNFKVMASNAMEYHWDFGDGNTSTEENPEHTYAAEGEYTVTLTVTGEEGSTSVELVKTVDVARLRVFEPVTVENADFALPGDDKYRNWSNVPGWNSDTQATDSGVEADGDGNYHGFIKTSDPAVYNLLDHEITMDDEEFKLNVTAWNTWNGQDFIVTIYYDSGDGVRNVLGTQAIEMAVGETQNIEFIATATTEAVGAKVGIEFSATAPSSAGWFAFDDVQMEAKK